MSLLRQLKDQTTPHICIHSVEKRQTLNGSVAANSHKTSMSILFTDVLHHLHFDKGIRVAVRVHGSQMSAAYNANEQTTFLCAVAQ